MEQHRRQPWWDGGMHPQIYGGDGYITILPLRMVNWTADKTATCVLLRKQRDMFAYSIFFLRKISVLHPFPK